MRRTRKIRALFAWLALFAFGLTIVAPVVSRTLASVAADSAHSGHHGMDGHMGTGHADADQPDRARNDHDGMLMEQCGYCGLLGHSPLLIVIAWLPGLLPGATPRQPVPTAPQRSPERSTLTAVPRGPPAFLPG